MNRITVAFEGDLASLDCNNATIHGDIIGDVDCTNLTCESIRGSVEATNVRCRSINK